MKAIIDIQSGRDQREKRREATREELHAMTDYVWRWSDLMGIGASICSDLKRCLSSMARLNGVKFAARREMT